ncbi:MAG: PTS N-acetylgalactosamine transporter subunit IIC [Mycoplasmatales bacterium]
MGVEALVIALLAGIAGIDLFNGLSHFHRPLVTGVIVGLILGDVKTGLIAGATFELIWLGAVPVGGAQPPNVVIGGIIGTAFAILTKQPPATAVGIAIPFAVAVQACITLFFTFFSPMMHKADKYAKDANLAGIEMINYLGMTILFCFYFIITFLPIYFGAESAATIVQMLPKKLIDAFGIAGGMMPAIGFAMLIKIMFKKEFAIYLVLGFILATYLKLPILAVAAIAICIAVYDYLQNKKVDELFKNANFSAVKDGEEDGI